MKAALGIDTSCYVTSVALVDSSGGVLFHGRQKLAVKEGLGLRQQEAVFAHIRQLPPLLEQAFALARENAAEIAAIGASHAPRGAADSYMPVFVAGLSQAEGLAAAWDKPLYRFSHQRGHVRAAMIGRNDWPEEMLCVHLSGGTTEILRVKGTEVLDTLGGSLDIAAGQLIDRIGVLMGLPFPAGPELEKLAMRAEKPGESLSVSMKGLDLNLSGLEAEAKRRLQRGADEAQLALGLFLALGDGLGKWIAKAMEQTKLSFALVAGGVAANAIIEKSARSMLPPGAELAFAPLDFAGDNACGTALLAMETLFCE